MIAKGRKGQLITRGLHCWGWGCRLLLQPLHGFCSAVLWPALRTLLKNVGFLYTCDVYSRTKVSVSSQRYSVCQHLPENVSVTASLGVIPNTTSEEGKVPDFCKNDRHISKLATQPYYCQPMHSSCTRPVQSATKT